MLCFCLLLLPVRTAHHPSSCSSSFLSWALSASIQAVCVVLLDLVSTALTSFTNKSLTLCYRVQKKQVAPMASGSKMKSECQRIRMPRGAGLNVLVLSDRRPKKRKDILFKLTYTRDHQTILFLFSFESLIAGENNSSLAEVNSRVCQRTSTSPLSAETSVTLLILSKIWQINSLSTE